MSRRGLTLAAGLMLLAAGCADHKAEIGEAASLVAREGGLARSDLGRARALAESLPEAYDQRGELLGAIRTADKRLETIQGAAQGIQGHLHGVENKPSWFAGLWAKVVGFGILALLVVCGVVVLVNMAPAVAAWLMVKLPKLMTWIPRTVAAQAKLQAELLAKNPNDPAIAAAIAAARVKRPVFEVAFKAEQKKLKSKGAAEDVKK